MQPLYIFLTRGVGTGKTFPLMCIIRYMLSYYIKQFVNLDPLKTKNYEINIQRKKTFNINGTTIHSALAIPLNKGLNELKLFPNEKKN